VVLSSALLALLAGCSPKDKTMNEISQIPSSIKKQLAFTCAHEKDRVPPRDPEADQLYKHARWIIKNNILKQDPLVYSAAERLLRIATAHGHDRANIELRDMLDKVLAASSDPVNEVIDLVQDLIKRGIPAGYYDMAWYVEHGHGVKRDPELAFKYYRKAADLGNPEGQYLVGDKLNNLVQNGSEISAIGLAMQKCAADQGHGKAAKFVGIELRFGSKYAESMKYFQIAASAGEAVSASSLSDGFSVKDHADPVFGLGQSVDLERERRYGIIQDFLHRYSYLNPSVPEIDAIVPLPPATLPAWDGKFQWLEAHKANVPPPLPSEERIAEMAKAKGLEPKTGRAVRAAK
jgi:uncharacterized protein